MVKEMTPAQIAGGGKAHPRLRAEEPAGGIVITLTVREYLAS